MEHCPLKLPSDLQGLYGLYLLYPDMMHMKYLRTDGTDLELHGVAA